MPRPICEVDKIYVRELLNKVKGKAKVVSLSSKEHYFQLQDSIKIHCDTKISHSTLVRLFGTASTTNPSEAILDICSKYIGFESWKDYLEDVRKFDRYMLQHELSIITIKKNIDVDHIHKLCIRYGHLPEILPFIFNVIQLAKEQKDIAFFAVLFSFPKLFDKAFRTEYDFYYIGQSVALCMRANEEMAERLAVIYCKNPIAIQYCIESFVDEDYLNGYYGKWLDEYHQHKKEEEALLFYYALKYKGAYMKEEFAEAKKWYKKILHTAHPKKLFKIVDARCTAILLIEEVHIPDSKNDLLYKKIIQIAKERDGFYIDYTLYILHYLYMAKRIEWVCFIVNIFDKYPANTDEHWLKKSWNALQMYRAFAYHLQDKKDEAISVFNTVDTDLFDPFMYGCMMKDYANIMAEMI